MLGIVLVAVGVACNAMLIPIDDIKATLAALLDRYGSDARIAVLPEGPQTVPYLLEAAV